MKKIVIIAAGLLLVAAGVWLLLGKKEEVITEKITEKSNMKISSSTFDHNQNIPQQYTCDGENISPPLSIGEVPATAKSLVLIVEDPDAPNGDFSHWLVWNIDPQIEEIGEGGVVTGSVSGTNDFGKTGYGGPCPPNGIHRYFFKIYALDTTLNIPAKSEKQELLNAISSHILDQGELIGLYGR